VLFLLSNLLFTILFSVMNILFLSSEELFFSLSWKRFSLMLRRHLGTFCLHSVLFGIENGRFDVNSWAKGAFLHLLSKCSFLMDSCLFSSFSLLFILVSMKSLTYLLWFSMSTSCIWMLFNVISLWKLSLFWIWWSSP